MSERLERGTSPPRPPTLRSRLYRLSSRFQRLIAPGLKNSQYAYSQILSGAVNENIDWLDLGCGHQLLPEWMPDWRAKQAGIVRAARSVTGIDMDEQAIRGHKDISNRVVGDIQRLPFRDASFDLVTANVVVEHVAHPDLLLEEVRRVLRPGGAFLFHTPNFLGYASLLAACIPQIVKNKLAAWLQGRKEEDVYPTFYRINTQAKIKSYAERAHFAVADLQLVESSAQTYMIPPLVVFEFLLIRLLRRPRLKGFRTNVIAVLKKEGQPESVANAGSPFAGVKPRQLQISDRVQ